jgi:hypothetical protein
MRRILAWSLTFALAAACSASLPVETPLGEGPMVAAEAKLAKMSVDAGKPDVVQDKAGDNPPAAPETPTPPVVASAPDASAPEPVAASSDAGSKPGKDAGPSAAASTYAGEYIGSDDTNTTIAGQTQTEHDDKAKTRVEARSSGELAFTFVSSSDGTDICTLTATVKGKDATFKAGQPCWATGGGASGKLTKGSAKFDGKKVSIDMAFDLSIGPATGTLTYRFTGTRK